MSDERDQESTIALELLEQLAAQAPAPAAETSADEASLVLRRLSLDALALLAYGLEPAAPAASTRDHLFSQLLGEETQEVEEIPAAGDLTQEVHPPPPPAQAAPRVEETRPVRRPGAGGEVVDLAAARRRLEPKPRRRWPLAVAAAVFALAAAGLGLWSASLVSEIELRDTKIRSLTADLEKAKRMESELTSTRADLAALETRHDFALTPGVIAFDMRPSGERPLDPYASGRLWVASDHQHWQLEVRGLPPGNSAQDYQLWFLIGDRPVSGGILSVRAGGPATMSSPMMPEGTTAVAITLEKKGGVPAPSGPVLLLGNRGVQI